MAETQLRMILGSHAHLPYGSEPGEFEKLYCRLLKPFVSSLYKHPHIQAAIHYSGVALHWIERTHPELFLLLEDMVSRKQIEMLGGGFYDPALPIISSQDKIGQIELLTTYQRKQFGKRPQGCWIPEYAWEHNLVSALASCGMNYTFLTERQFAIAGGQMAPCICEDRGKTITVFPVFRSLENALAGKSICALFSEIAKKNGASGIYTVFPQKIIAKNGDTPDMAWNRFFDDLESCKSLVQTVSPGKLLKGFKGLQKLYFPDSCGDENGKAPRSFIVENPESGRVYAKMVFTNVLINQLRGDKSRKLAAHEELWKSQGSALFCNTGKQGVYNQALRSAAYSALLNAERISREKTKFAASLVPFDFKLDGDVEWLFQDARINCYIQSSGGSVFELDYLPKAWNYLNSFHGRSAFADRLLPHGASPANLKHGLVSKARMCCSERYEMQDMDKVRRKLKLALPINENAASFGKIAIDKTLQLKKDTVVAAYSIMNKGAKPEAFCFAPEIDIALPGGGENFARFFTCKTALPDAPLAVSEIRGADGVKIHDLINEAQIVLNANRSFDGKISPLYIPDPQSGEKLFQAYCLMPLFALSLKPAESWDIEFALKFSH